MTLIINNARDLFFTSAEEYRAWRSAHRQKARDRALTAEDCAIFALLTGRDLYKAFSPSQKLVVNGQPPYATLSRILDGLRTIRWSREPQEPATPLERLRAYLHVRLRNAPDRQAAIAAGRATAGDLDNATPGSL